MDLQKYDYTLDTLIPRCMLVGMMFWKKPFSSGHNTIYNKYDLFCAYHLST